MEWLKAFLIDLGAVVGLIAGGCQIADYYCSVVNAPPVETIVVSQLMTAI